MSRQEWGKTQSALHYCFVLIFVSFVVPFAHAAPCNGVSPEPQFSQQNNIGAIRIADIAFTSRVEARCPVDRLSNKSNISKKITLWMRIQGSQEAINLLRRDGRLPVRHRWIAIVGTKKHHVSEDIAVAESMLIDLEKLQTEVEAISTFDWRTQSTKTKWFPKSTYIVEIRDNRGAPVPCADNIDCEVCGGTDIKCGVRLLVK